MAKSFVVIFVVPIRKAVKVSLDCRNARQDIVGYQPAYSKSFGTNIGSLYEFLRGVTCHPQKCPDKKKKPSVQDCVPYGGLSVYWSSFGLSSHGGNGQVSQSSGLQCFFPSHFTKASTAMPMAARPMTSPRRVSVVVSILQDTARSRSRAFRLPS